jgi:hypothetical protein
MDRILRLLKRQAVKSDNSDDWQVYIKTLERCVGGVDTGAEYMYLALVIPHSSNLEGDSDPSEQWYPMEEWYNPQDWGVFETDKEAFGFALSKVKQYLLTDDVPAWVQAINEIEQNFNSGDYDEFIKELVEMYNLHPGLRDEGFFVGHESFHLPYIYIITIQ